MSCVYLIAAYPASMRREHVREDRSGVLVYWNSERSTLFLSSVDCACEPLVGRRLVQRGCDEAHVFVAQFDHPCQKLIEQARHLRRVLQETARP
jgi:hypothetical protein